MNLWVGIVQGGNDKCWEIFSEMTFASNLKPDDIFKREPADKNCFRNLKEVLLFWTKDCSILSLLTAIKGSIYEFGLFSWTSTFESTDSLSSTEAKISKYQKLQKVHCWQFHQRLSLSRIHFHFLAFCPKFLLPVISVMFIFCLLSVSLSPKNKFSGSPSTIILFLWRFSTNKETK